MFERFNNESESTSEACRGNFILVTGVTGCTVVKKLRGSADIAS